MAQLMKLLLPALLSFLFLLAPAQGARSLVPAPGPSATTAGTTKCGLSSVSVETVNTGETVTTGGGHDPVFEVTVRNGCACAVRAVSLRSEGFASSVAVDPRLFRRDEAARDYFVAGGARIESGAEVRFRYAWDRAFRMAPAAVRDDCS